MFTKDNVLQARYLDPENTMIEVLYTSEDGKTRKFNFPARPTTSRYWKTLKETGWTANKLKKQTIEWIRAQRRGQEYYAADLAKRYAATDIANIQAAEAERYKQRVAEEAARFEERSAEEAARYEKLSAEEKKQYDEKLEAHKKMSAEEKAAFEKEQTKLYEGRIAHIVADIENSKLSTDDVFHNQLYDILTSDVSTDEEMIFKFKMRALEDKSNFEELNKTEEKQKRRSIRKASSIKEIIGIL